MDWVSLGQADLYPLFEIIHAIRDNLNIDMREDASRYFKSLPLWYVASFYPAPYEAAANEYMIPPWSGKENGFSARGGAGSRGWTGYRSFGHQCHRNAIRAGLPDAGPVQHARSVRRTVRVPVGESISAGVRDSLLPTVYYDARRGALFVRSNWDEDARWFGIVGGEYQLFEDGRVGVLEMGPAAGAPRPLELGSAEIVQWRVPLKVDAAADALFVVGGRAGAKYNVEIEDEEMQEAEADRSGTLRFDLPKDRHPRVYLSAARR